MNNYGKQIACIVYGGGINLRSAVKEYTDAGYVAIYSDRCVRIHERAK